MIISKHQILHASVTHVANKSFKKVIFTSPFQLDVDNLLSFDGMLPLIPPSFSHVLSCAHLLFSDAMRTTVKNSEYGMDTSAFTDLRLNAKTTCISHLCLNGDKMFFSFFQFN